MFVLYDLFAFYSGSAGMSCAVVVRLCWNALVVTSTFAAVMRASSAAAERGHDELVIITAHCMHVCDKVESRFGAKDIYTYIYVYASALRSNGAFWMNGEAECGCVSA